jgi:two-component system cell cycle response regulator
MSNGGPDDESAAFAAALQGALAQEGEPARVVGPAREPWALVVVNGASVGRVLALTDAAQLTVGRAAPCDLVLQDDGVSRRHLVVAPTAAGWLVEVEGGSSGAYLNGERFKRTVVKLDDKIQLGTSTILAVRRLDDVSADAERDALTGLLHKAAFAARVKAAYAKAVETNEPLTLALMNLDFFMRFNDHYGFRTGDAALRVHANLLSAALPPSCAIGRISGDGFAILLEGVALPEARTLLEPMRARASAYPIAHESTHVTVTMSLGLAMVPAAEITTPKELVRRADEQLFLAKRYGRARTMPDV